MVHRNSTNARKQFDEDLWTILYSGETCFHEGRYAPPLCSRLCHVRTWRFIRGLAACSLRLLSLADTYFFFGQVHVLIPRFRHHFLSVLPVPFVSEVARADVKVEVTGTMLKLSLRNQPVIAVRAQQPRKQ